MVRTMTVLPPNMGVQRTRSPLRSPLTPHPIGRRLVDVVRKGSRILLVEVWLVAASGCGETAGKSPAPTPVTQPPPAAQLTPTATVYQVGGDVVAPRLLNRVEPPIPERCRKARLDSSVIMYEATILETGDVAEVKTLKLPNVSPPCQELEAATHAAISQWKYEPATLHGKPVRARLTITQTLYLR